MRRLGLSGGMLGAMSVEKTSSETPNETTVQELPADGPGEPARTAGEVARMTPEQLAIYNHAMQVAREVAHAHSRAERQRDQMQKQADKARLVAEQAAKNAEKAAERAAEADQHVSHTAQEILKELGVYRPGAKLEIAAEGAIIDVEARSKQQNGRTN
jgi:hypothetical protein